MEVRQMIEDGATQGKVETVRTQGFRCLVDSTWRTRLLDLLDKPDPMDWANWTEIKHSTVRTIYQGAIAGCDVHLKLFRAVRLSDRARDALTGSRAAREFENLVAAREHGLPCVAPIAAGSFGGSFGSRSFLLTVTEPGACLPRGRLNSDDATAAGRLLRRAHDAGLHSKDLHPGNLLRRADATLVLLDLTSAVFAECLDVPSRARGLAFFCIDLDANVLDPAARPLLAGYGADRDLIARAGQDGLRLRNRSVSAYGRRAFRRCKTTLVEHRARSPHLYLHTGASDLWDAARAAFAGLSESTPIKSGRRGSVHLFEKLAVKERSAAAARRLFEAAYWLDFAGVPTPTPVALTTFKSRGMVAAARLPHPNLVQDLADGLRDDRPSLLAAAEHLGDTLGRLHSYGLRNRDLKFENLIREPSNNEVYLVDLDGVRRQLPADNRGRANDLGRLLAAFQHAGNPGGDAMRRTLLRRYVRTCRRLLYPVPHRRHLLAEVQRYAADWAASHAAT